MRKQGLMKSSGLDFPVFWFWRIPQLMQNSEEIHRSQQATRAAGKVLNLPQSPFRTSPENV